MNSLRDQLILMFALTAVLFATLEVPNINRTNRLIAGDDVVSYYGLPKPDIYGE
jgi:hypothetical protein